MLSSFTKVGKIKKNMSDDDAVAMVDFNVGNEKVNCIHDEYFSKVRKLYDIENDFLEKFDFNSMAEGGKFHRA